MTAYTIGATPSGLTGPGPPYTTLWDSTPGPGNLGEPSDQPSHGRDVTQQPGPGMRHHPGPVRSDGDLWVARCSVHLRSAFLLDDS